MLVRTRRRRADGRIASSSRTGTSPQGPPGPPAGVAEIRRRSNLRLTVAGADPLAVRLLLARLRVPDDGIDVVGFLSQDDLTTTLLGAKALVSPSIGQESFGMVITRAFACALPVVASDIPGYREVMTPEAGMAVARRAEALVTRSARSWTTRVARLGEAVALWPSSGTRGRRSPSGSNPSIRASRGSAPRRAARRELAAKRLGVGVGAGCRRRRRIRRRGHADLVARPGVGKRARRVQPRDLELDHPRVRAECLSTLFRALSWMLTWAGARQSTSRSSSMSSRPSESGCSRTRSCRAGSASSRASPRFVVTFRMLRPARVRPWSARSSPTVSSTSCRRRSSSSGCC